jgi:IS5 family transposase
MAIVDAAIIESSCRPRMKFLEEIVKDRSEADNINKYLDPEEIAQLSELKYQELASTDSDAKWSKKGNKFYFNHKSFATVDEDGFVMNTTIPTNESEVSN